METKNTTGSKTEMRAAQASPAAGTGNDGARRSAAHRHIRVGGVEATIWRNEANGQVLYSVTLQRSYKDKSGSWKTTYSLRQNDLPKALLALQKAFEHVALYSQESRALSASRAGA